MKNPLLFVLARIVPIAIGIGIAFTSCKNTSSDVDQPPLTVYAPPVVQPLKFSKAIKINWDSIKGVLVHPVVKPFDLDKLPAQSYDTAGFKPFKYPVEEAKLDIDALPEKDLDIDKLPSHPLKFTTEKLPPPKLIHAGPPHLKHFNLSLFELGQGQSLEGTFITCLFTDRDGFLWIASDKRLYRYDGGNLLLYMPVTFPHFIWSMAQDTSGRLWLPADNNGDLEVLDPIAGTLLKTNKSLGLNSNNTWRILKDKRQRMWEIAGPAINIIDPKTQTVQLLDKAHGLADTASSAMALDKMNRMWISCNGGINVIDLGSKKIKYLDKSNGLRSDTVDNLLFDQSGRLWLGLHGGVMNIVDQEKKTIEAISEAQHPKALVPALCQDRLGRIWVGTAGRDGNGLEVIDPENRTAKNIKKINGLNGDAILSVNQDSQGQVWIGTLGGLDMISANSAVTERIGKAQVNFLEEDSKGLEWDQSNYTGIDLIDRKNKTIRHLGVTQGLGNDTTLQVSEINGKIYIPTSSGLDIIDRTKKTISHIGKAQGFNSRLTQNITADKSGRIWMAEDDGLGVYDPINNTVKVIPKAEFFNNDVITVVQAGPGGQIWLSTNSGLVYVVDPFTYRIQKLDRNGLQNGTGSGGSIFLADKNGYMWIGTDHGIYIADKANKTLAFFSVPQGLIDERIATLLQRDNKIYASTVGGVTIITPPVEGIVTNKKWGAHSFGNEYGLKKLNTGFTLTDAIGSDGYFLWGDYGVTVLDLSKRDTSRPPAYISGMNIMDQPANFIGRSHTVLNGIAWDGVNGPFNAPVNLQLPHDQNYVQFNFGTLNFRAHDTTWYTYKLIGKDTGWSAKTTLDHSRNYFSLAPGKYTFEVASKSSDNGWSKPAVLSFTIDPPWWLTWWAYILYAILFAGIVWSFAYFRSLQLVKEKRVLEQKIHLRTEEVMQQKEEIEAQRDDLEKAFKELKITQTQLIQSEKMASLGELTAGIAHEIQNPLNFVNNFSEVNTELIEELQQEIVNGNYEDVKAIAVDIKENQQKINQHGKRADFIVKGMLQHSRSGSGERQLTNINVLAGEFFKLSFQGLRAKDKLFNAEMVTHFDKTIPEINIVQQDIGRVLLNLFNNAFYAVNQKQKTSGADYKPEVTVATTKENGHVIIKVKDNGVGIPDAIKEKIMQPFFTTKPTGEGTGLGLSLTYDMVVKGHGGSIQVNSVEGEGSEFVITLPIT